MDVNDLKFEVLNKLSKKTSSSEVYPGSCEKGRGGMEEEDELEEGVVML